MVIYFLWSSESMLIPALVTLSLTVFIFEPTLPMFSWHVVLLLPLCVSHVW